MRFMKPVATALAVTVGALTFATSAEAGHRHRHHRGGGEAAAAGIIGFAAGAILGGALSGPRYDHGYHSGGYYDGGYYNGGYYEPEAVYVEPAPVYVQPAPAYYAVEPWTPEWYDYCESKYRSFNPSTGYFKGYDGQFHLCR
jgi:hypothetical protein